MDFVWEEPTKGEMSVLENIIVRKLEAKRGKSLQRPRR